jgi:hypothetical protein
MLTGFVKTDLFFWGLDICLGLFKIGHLFLKRKGTFELYVLGFYGLFRLFLRILLNNQFLQVFC